MSINLSISFSCPGSIAQQVSYARIDNTTPVYIQVPNITGSEGNFVVASDIPDGQYIVSRIPIYADGRICQARTVTTPACPGLISISATIQGGVLVVTYLAPSGSPSVLINVNYPNGGTFSQIYTNTGNPISIGLPAGVYGNYTVNGQSVCDPTSGFYSPPSASVTVNYAQSVSGSYYLGNTIAQVCAASITTLYSNGAPTPNSVLYADSGLTTPITGYILVMYQNIVYNLSSTTGVLGTDSGLSCSITITGNTSLSAGITNGNGLIMGPAGATVSATISASGPPGGTYTFEFTISSLGLTQTVSNGVNTFTFTMPPSGSVSWSALFTSTNSSGGGGVSV